MRIIPVLHGDGLGIPYELVKQHEAQVMKNHGQTLDRICERGGLDWAELYFVLNDRTFDRGISREVAMDGILKKIYKFYSEPTNNKSINTIPNLRPCTVRLSNDKNSFSTNAYFHRWGNKIEAIEPSGNSIPGGIISYSVGIVEYENGDIDEIRPQNIKFTDRG